MSEEIKKFFSTYTDFVTKVTSEPSIDLDALKKSFDEIEQSSGIKTPRLLTAALGLGSETGEFVEIVKKMYLQGKPPSEDNIFHMKRELGGFKDCYHSWSIWNRFRSSDCFIKSWS